MKENFIQLKNDDVLRLKIIDKNGVDTGEILEFDLEDIELPLKYQELLENDKKNRRNLQNQLVIIEKRQDVKGKKLLSKNQEDKFRVINDFFQKEIEVYNMFLGKNGVQKLLNGRKIGWTTLQEIDEIINNQISPYLDITMEKITNKIKNKYGNKSNENREKLSIE